MLACLLHGLILCIPLQKNISSAETLPPATWHAVLRAQKTAQNETDVAPPAPENPKPAARNTPRTPSRQTATNSAPPPSLDQTATAHIPPQATPPLTEDTATVTADPPPAAKPTTPRFDAAYLNNPRPLYPTQSRHQNEAGKVLLKVRVSQEGYALSVDVLQSSHSSRLDHAARQAVSQWRFIPAKLGDQPIVAEVIVPIIFKLDD